MPSLMVHYGTTLIAGWPLRHKSLTVALLLGATWPDVAWMVLHVLGFGLPKESQVFLQFYAQAFHTPLMCLWAGLIFACLVHRPWRQVAAFIGAALFHLLLDTFQTRYGNGVALAYPLSWQIYDFELFWEEGPIGLALLVVSIGLVLYTLQLGIEPLHLRRPPCFLVGLLVIGFLLMPLATLQSAQKANVFNMAFVYSPSDFEGKEVGFERNMLLSTEPARIMTWYSRELILNQVSDAAKAGDQISVRGIYREGTLDVTDFHIHWRHLHSGPSLVALAMLSLMLWRPWRQGAKCIRPWT